MKKILVWSLCLLLLTGCEKARPEDFSKTVQTAPPKAPQWTAFEVYPLEQPQVTALYPMGDDLLLESSGVLARIDCETLATTAQAEVASSVSSLQVFANRVSFYDPFSRELTVLDGQLRETLRLSLPEDMTGNPWLSEDGNAIFYCTENAIRVLDTETGVSRVLKEDTSAGKNLEGLLLQDTVIHCTYDDPVLGRRSLFLRADTGRTLLEREQLSVRSHGERYYAQLPEEMVFGSSGQPMTLVPRDSETFTAFLPQANLAITATASPEITLHCYDLSSGTLSAELTPQSPYMPRGFCLADGVIWFLLWDGEKDALCRWDISVTAAENSTVYTAQYYTASNPDAESLLACAREAERIGKRFGIRVLTWTDAIDPAPDDYSLEAEHRTYIINQELRLLEERLTRFPKGFLEQLGGVTLCLVRSISPSPSNPSEETSEAIHFRDESGSYLILASDQEQVLWHQLYHLIESRVLTHSRAYDNWDSLNPGDFEYDYDYEENRMRDGSAFLRETSRSFVDTFSMSFPSEDRARIMEYAMTPGNAELFSAPILQQKLTNLCSGIREAFGLTDYTAPLPWEQYLLNPVAPASRE